MRLGEIVAYQRVRPVCKCVHVFGKVSICHPNVIICLHGDWRGGNGDLTAKDVQ